MECFAAGGAVQNSGIIAIEGLSIGAGFTRFAGTLTVTPGAVLARVAIFANYGGGGVTQLQAVRLTDDSRASELSASLVQESVVRASVDGGLLAQYTVKIDVAGLVSGYGLASTAVGAAPSSTFAVRANSFYIAPPAVASSSPPNSGLYNGFVWLDTSVPPAVTTTATDRGALRPATCRSLFKPHPPISMAKYRLQVSMPTIFSFKTVLLSMQKSANSK